MTTQGSEVKTPQVKPLRRPWKRTGKSIVGALATVMASVILVCSFRSAFADWSDVYSASMKPTILEGDRVVVNKLAYDFHIPFINLSLRKRREPQRGEIVAFYSPHEGTRLIKRIIGIPGDRVLMKNNILYVNGERAHYGMPDAESDKLLAAPIDPLLKVGTEEIDGESHPIMLSAGATAIATFGPIRIPEGMFFVLGDNRDESIDSRDFGLVERERIFGQATAVAASVNPERHFLPRWSRFFYGLP